MFASDYFKIRALCRYNLWNTSTRTLEAWLDFITMKDNYLSYQDYKSSKNMKQKTFAVITMKLGSSTELKLA